MKNRFAYLFVFLPALVLAQGGQPAVVTEMLSKAARTGDLKNVESLITAGVNPNTPNQDDRTPLYYAALFDRGEVTALLLASKADPNFRAGSGAHGGEQTPLQIAASMGNLHVASMLIDAGANVRAITDTGRTALHFAVLGSHLDLTRLLIEKGAVIDARDAEGTSALDESVWRGCLETAAILLAHGAPLDEPETKTGATPINEAAYSNRLRLIPYLLQFHPNLLLPDRHGYTPLANAIRMRNEDVAILLLKAAPQEQKTASLLNKMLAVSAQKNESRIADLLLSEGASANASVRDASTALDIAVSAGGADVVRILLARGADPNRTDHDGSSPLENAAVKGVADIVAMLLDRGANVDWINGDSGTTALYGAAAFGRAAAVKVLLQRGADLNLCGHGKITPYKAALENGFNDIATELQRRGGSSTCSESGR